MQVGSCFTLPRPHRRSTASVPFSFRNVSYSDRFDRTRAVAERSPVACFFRFDSAAGPSVLSVSPNFRIRGGLDCYGHERKHAIFRTGDRASRGPEDTRLRFSGPPKSLTGIIPLVNTGSEKQKIRSVAVNSAKLLGAARLPLREFPFYARLYGGEQVSVPATLCSIPRLPPGSYDLELTVGARTLPATAHVSEVVDLRLDPVQITILAGSATSYTERS